MPHTQKVRGLSPRGDNYFFFVGLNRHYLVLLLSLQADLKLETIFLKFILLCSNVLKSYQIHTELPSSEEWVIIGNVNRGAEAFKIRPSRRAELVIL